MDEATERDLERKLIIVTAITLRNFSNNEIAALNLAVTGWGRVAPENMAYKKSIKCALIRADGFVHDVWTMTRACAYEITRRMDAGTFT